MSEPSAPLQRRSPTADDDADRAALARVAAGELDALEILYDRYRAMAYAIALRVTGDAAAAEDVLQDAFLGAWRHADRYAAARGSVKTWLLAIVHHRAIDAVRRRRPTTELPEPEAPASTPEPLRLPDVFAEVAGRLDAVAIRSALATLPEVQREALELAYYGGLSQTEVAERTGAPLGTVKSRMRLGLLTLRRALGGDVDGARESGP